jgi:uncharacterized OsmC-like protein
LKRDSYWDPLRNDPRFDKLLAELVSAARLKLKRPIDLYLDVRGTLGIEKDVTVGFKQIRLRIVLDTDATPDEQARLMELTERYCVVYQTLCRGSGMSMSLEAAGKPAQ